ncbi:hydroxyethylthiazole kinase [Companilactobacillus sp. RD055328]|uniref:hydroxyethylthiazole kinase n=1 Tax=Companilactobacillus sp. RD055328 TaxID=2916634 RepID=UPI001FC8E210|nr:hydroxyethylthiazole kinase [Companilactobacillus sp. RD055328]GKQ42201.1 hydroxyethylthiazole kinase [Companilactobacillus sp. RD055328]
MLDKYLLSVREQTPLIHNITNYVTINDCANILLASGASPIMADDQKEVEEITSICNGLNINIGTLNENTSAAMIAAGKKANELNIPVELDPVGVGASDFRKKFIKELMSEVKFSVIKGNTSEITIMAAGVGQTRGVDAVTDEEDNIEQLMEYSQQFSQKTGAIIVMSGATDIVSNANSSAIIKNGVATMSKITGTGCMLSALLTGFIAANKDEQFEAVTSAVCMMGLAGQKAEEIRNNNNAGTASFRNYLIDEISKMTPDELEKGAKYEIKK